MIKWQNCRKKSKKTYFVFNNSDHTYLFKTIPHTILQMDETMQKINNKALALNEELAKRTRILEEKVQDQIHTTQSLNKYIHNMSL